MNEYESSPAPRQPLQQPLVAAFVTGYYNGFKHHPPSAMARSKDPREYDAIDHERLRRTFIEWAMDSELLQDLPVKTLSALIDQELKAGATKRKEHKQLWPHPHRGN